MLWPEPKTLADTVVEAGGTSSAGTQPRDDGREPCGQSKSVEVRIARKATDSEARFHVPVWVTSATVASTRASPSALAASQWSITAAAVSTPPAVVGETTARVIRAKTLYRSKRSADRANAFQRRPVVERADPGEEYVDVQPLRQGEVDLSRLLHRAARGFGYLDDVEERESVHSYESLLRLQLWGAALSKPRRHPAYPILLLLLDHVPETGV